MAGRSLILSLVLAAALAVPAVAAARPFYGTVAAPSTITLKRANGTTVNHASPGTRKFVILTSRPSTTSTSSGLV
jgi:hypothetical protein